MESIGMENGFQTKTRKTGERFLYGMKRKAIVVVLIVAVVSIFLYRVTRKPEVEEHVDYRIEKITTKTIQLGGYGQHISVNTANVLHVLGEAGVRLEMTALEEGDAVSVTKKDQGIILNVRWTKHDQDTQHRSYTISAKQLSYQTMNYINEYRNDDGFYYYYASSRVACNDTDSCPVNPDTVSGIANMWIILGKVGYYKHFQKDASVLTDIERDADVLINGCKERMIDCLLTTFPLAELYSVDPNESYRSFIEKLGSILLNDGDQKSKSVQILAMQSRVLTRLYSLTGEQGYLKKAREKLQNANSVMRVEEKMHGFPDDEACYVNLAQTEVGRHSIDINLLIQAKNFFLENQEAKIPRELNLIQPCIESAFMLGEYFHDTRITNDGKALLQQFVTQRWDDPIVGNGYRKGGFFMSDDHTFITMTDTGYMLYLLSLDPDMIYEFKQ